MTTNGNDKMPDRVLTLDPTRKDTGVNRIPLITLHVVYDPMNHDIEVKGPKGLDIVGLIGILDLAKTAIVTKVARRL
jgi:hypothetical protein